MGIMRTVTKSEVKEKMKKIEKKMMKIDKRQKVKCEALQGVDQGLKNAKETGKTEM